MYLADTLSRAPRASTLQHVNELNDFEVMSFGRVSSSHLEELKRHTVEDDLLQTLSSVIRHGWPAKQHSAPPSVSPFFPFRDELTVEKGVIMKGHRLPQSLQTVYTGIMHRGHKGAESTQRRARDIVFGPPMNRDIDRAVTRDHINRKNHCSHIQYSTCRGLLTTLNGIESPSRCLQTHALAGTRLTS